MKRFALLVTLFLATAACAQSSAPPQTLNAANQCARIGAVGQATVGIQVIGTFSATLQPEVSIQGQAPQNAQVTPSTSSTPQSTITAAGAYTATVAGYNTFLVCVSDYTSGAAVVYLNAVNGGAGNALTGGAAGLPLNSLQGNNAGKLQGLPGSSIDFTNGLLGLAPPGTGTAESVTGDAHGSDLVDWFLYGSPSTPFVRVQPSTYPAGGINITLTDPLGDTVNINPVEIELFASGNPSQIFNCTLVNSANPSFCEVIGFPTILDTRNSGAYNVALSVGGGQDDSDIQDWTAAGGFTASVSSTGLFSTPNACKITTPLTLTASPQNVCRWYLPALAQPWAWKCDGIYSLTAGTLPTLILGMNASQAPTSETGSATIESTLTGTETQATVTSTSAGQVILLTGATNTQANAQFSTFGTVQASATAGTFAITAYYGGTGSPAGTVNVGTVCNLF